MHHQICEATKNAFTRHPTYCSSYSIANYHANQQTIPDVILWAEHSPIYLALSPLLVSSTRTQTHLHDIPLPTIQTTPTYSSPPAKCPAISSSAAPNLTLHPHVHDVWGRINMAIKTMVHREAPFRLIPWRTCYGSNSYIGGTILFLHAHTPL